MISLCNSDNIMFVRRRKVTRAGTDWLKPIAILRYFFRFFDIMRGNFNIDIRAILISIRVSTLSLS